MTKAKSDSPDRSAVHDFLVALQERIVAALESLDGQAQFQREEIPRPGGGVSRPWILEGGPLFEKAAVNFTHTQGNELPPAVTGLVIAADHDTAGIMAAKGLCVRVRLDDVDAHITKPDRPGDDWNDVIRSAKELS